MTASRFAPDFPAETAASNAPTASLAAVQRRRSCRDPSIIWLLGLCISSSAVAFGSPVGRYISVANKCRRSYTRGAGLTLAAVQARRKLLIILLLLKVPQRSRSANVRKAFCLRTSTGECGRCWPRTLTVAASPNASR